MRDNELSKEELEFLDVSSEVFKKGQSLEEYKSDIKRRLMLCPWKYSSELADRTIELYSIEISLAHFNEEPVADIACDIGYCCG